MIFGQHFACILARFSWIWCLFFQEHNDVRLSTLMASGYISETYPCDLAYRLRLAPPLPIKNSGTPMPEPMKH